MLTRRKKQRMGVRPTDEGRSAGHLQFVRGFVCACHEAGDCEGKIEAHHENEDMVGTMGGKTEDRNAAPLCAFHHRRRHDLGRDTFAAVYKVNLSKVAEQIARVSPHLRRPTE